MTNRLKIGLLLTAIWLLLTGLIAILGLRMDSLPVIMGILAIAAGIFLILGLLTI